MKDVLSAIQPTGEMHFGNYFGAVQNWVRLQENYDCVYGVVDYHAITMPTDYQKLRNNTWELIFNLIAVGIKPENLFIQSLIPEHTELSWILSCFTSYGQLTRMTQFKDKSSKSREETSDSFISAGLLSYPVLQAADILIYRPKFVPIGKDQEQHLELTRNIALKFNNSVNKEYFRLPEILFTETPKIKSTANPEIKMSKSAGEKHYISVFAEESIIRKQIKSAVTDTGEVSEGKMSPGIENLFEIIKACGKNEDYTSLMNDYNSGALKYVALKESVADALSELSNQFKLKKNELLLNKKEVKENIKQSSSEIRKIAQQTVKDVKELTGLQNVKY
ncbi:MAG: tryptophan--tRNA ligase [Deltaproteobacteria bacterium]